MEAEFPQRQNRATSMKEYSLKQLRVTAKAAIQDDEDNNVRRIEELKVLVRQELETETSNFRLHPPCYDDFYLQCLRARKNNVARAAKLYRKYCKIASSNLHILSRLKPSLHAHRFEEQLCSVLKTGRDDKGRLIFIVRVEKWIPKVTDFNDFLACLMLLMNEAILSEDTQLHGVTVIGDMTGLSFSHVKLISPSAMRTVAAVLQDAYPARFKEFHAVNNPPILNLIWALGKPFLTDKMKKRFFFHGYNIPSLHKSLQINPVLLPEFLGGQVSNEEFANVEMISTLLTKDDYFEEFYKYGRTCDQ